MAQQTLLSATYSLNTAGGANSPAPTDSYASTLSAGTYSAGPMGVTVTSTPTVMPLSAATPGGPATAIYSLMVAHTGLSTDPSIVLDMQNTAGDPSKITIAPGGRIYMHNVTLPITGTGATNWTKWTLSVASGSTTAAVSIVYT